jgi:hypothetical protein
VKKKYSNAPAKMGGEKLLEAKSREPGSHFLLLTAVFAGS